MDIILQRMMNIEFIKERLNKFFCGKAASGLFCSLLLSAVLLFGKLSTAKEIIWTLLNFHKDETNHQYQDNMC